MFKGLKPAPAFLVAVIFLALTALVALAGFLALTALAFALAGFLALSALAFALAGFLALTAFLDFTVFLFAFAIVSPLFLFEKAFKPFLA